MEVTFNYTVNEDTDVWIYCYPQSRGSSISDYGTWASGPYSGQGTAIVEFTVTTTPVLVDEIILVTIRLIFDLKMSGISLRAAFYHK